MDSPLPSWFQAPSIWYAEVAAPQANALGNDLIGRLDRSRRARYLDGPVMLSEPALSVIITTHNRSRHLEPALVSWARQSHGNFELIVVDCDSNDGTRAMLEKWQG